MQGYNFVTRCRLLIMHYICANTPIRGTLLLGVMTVSHLRAITWVVFWMKAQAISGLNLVFAGALFSSALCLFPHEEC